MNTDDRQLRADPPGTSPGDGATVSGNHRDGLRLAMAHHWFIEPRGGERVLAHLADMFPGAPILTSTARDPASWWPAQIAALRPRIVTGPTHPILRHLAGSRWGEPLLAAALPLAMLGPFAIDWDEFDALLVSDAGLAKCIPAPPHVQRFVYLHTPMRFVWHDLQRTLARFPAAVHPIVRAAARVLRAVDRRAARRVDRWAANSRITARRAAAAYDIPIERIRVIPPPIIRPPPAPELPRRGLLVVSSMQPYKRDDLAIASALRLGVALTVAGDGGLRRSLEALGGGRVHFTGAVTDQELDVLYRSAEALLFCGEEDFGLVPVEAMARGTPVIAFRAGGVLETVEEGVSGIFFDLQTPEAVEGAIRAFFARSWDPAAVRHAVERFSPVAFERAIRGWLGRG